MNKSQTHNRETHGPAPSDHDTVDDAALPLLEQHGVEDVVEEDAETQLKVQAAQYPHVVKNLLENERKLDRLKVRSKQAIIHQSLTALRIEELERQVNELEVIVYDKENVFKPKEKPKEKFPKHLHEMRRLNKNDFHPSEDAKLLPTELQPALEVLVSPWSTIPLPSTTTTTANPSTTTTSAPLSTLPLTAMTQGSLNTQRASPQSSKIIDENSPDSQLTPERLRIRSRPLLYHLEKVCGVPVLSNARQTIMGEFEKKTVYSGVTFLRPFKLFVKFEDALRQSLTDLSRDIPKGRLDSEATDSDSGDKADDHGITTDISEKFDREDLLEDLKLLIEFFDVDLRPMLQLRRQIEDATATEIAYADLWHLFERGDTVVTASSQLHAYMVLNYAGGRDRLRTDLPDSDSGGPPKPPLEGFMVDCLSIGTDGSTYVPKIENIVIRKFYGTKPITSLPVYPLRFDPRANSLRAQFLRHGSKFVEVTRKPFCHVMIRGKTLDEPSYELDDQVIVDTTLAIDAMPEWRPSTRITDDDLSQRDRRETIAELLCKHSSRYAEEGCCGADTIFKDLELDSQDAEVFHRKSGSLMSSLRVEDLTDEAILTIRPFVHAFVLRSRRWVTARVEDLHEVVFENSFKDLVLPSNDKTIIQALVQTHHNATGASRSATPKTSSVGTALDIVKGKGRGLIILLHGPPGVGKTSTAECVADDTRKPLFPITCGDLGETAVDVENSLQYNFRLAHKWGCVLLLDEADVFLAKRTKTDLRHNAVTSIFLRSLEYYAGILFLTTNRVGAMDPAFKSRIQLSLAYNVLNLEVTMKLYEKFIRRAKAEQERTNTYNFKIKEKEILRFGKKHFRRLEKEGYDTWNGRQIRNAFQTAIALAEHTNQTKGDDEVTILGKEQFETVAQGLRAFDNYLILAHGFTESEAAKREGVRNDTFATQRPTATPIPSISKPIQESQYSDSSDDSASESYSDSDTDSDGERNDAKVHQKTKAKSRETETGGAKENNSSSQANQMEQFQQFLKWQKMQ